MSAVVGVARIVAVGVAMLVAVKGLVMLGVWARPFDGIWRALIGVSVVLLLVPRKLWLRALTWMISFAGAAGFAWVFNQTVRPWLEQGTLPRLEEYTSQIIVFTLYLLALVAWEMTRGKVRSRD